MKAYQRKINFMKNKIRKNDVNEKQADTGDKLTGK